MLRVVFFGMEIEILDELRLSSVDLLGVHLPPASYWIRKYLFPLFRVYPGIVRKRFNTVGVYGHVYDFLREHEITALQSPDVNSPNFISMLGSLRPDLGIIANFGEILGGRLLGIPSYGFVNFHPSLLPRYRGPAPLARIFLNGDTISGATWHRVTESIDQGDILAQKTFPIGPNDTIAELKTNSVQLARRMLPPLLKDIEAGRAQAIPQNEAEATYHPKLTEAEKKRLERMGKLA